MQPKGAFKSIEIAMKGSWEEIHGFDEDATYVVTQLVLSRQSENKTAKRAFLGLEYIFNVNLRNCPSKGDPI